MSKLDDAAKEIVQALEERTARSTSGYDTLAEVKRVSGNTAWVHIDGGVDETPVNMSIDCKKGDMVRVRVSNGTAFIVGNETKPPTDDAEALIAKSVAALADGKATTAKTTAEGADRNASQARVIAETAQDEIVLTNERVQGLDDSVKDSLEDINTSLYGDDDESGFQGLLESAITNIENLSTDYSQLWNNVYGFMKFGEDEQGRPILTLGSENSSFKTNITNEMIQFTYNDAPIAYLTGTALRVQDQLSFGNFVIYQRPNGHLTIKYIGGN